MMLKRINELKLGNKALLVLLATAVSSTIHAEDKVADEGWGGSAELGIVNTTGNTETETISAKAKAETEREKWRHTINFEALNSSDQNVSTAERYFLSGQSSYKIGKKNFFFVLVSYEDDRFSGYDYRVTESIGYGRRVIAEPGLTLDLEIGPGARQSKLDSGASEDELMVRGAAKLAWKISKTSKFSEDFSTDVGEDVTITKSVTALSAQVNSSLATKITYTIKNTSDVPAGVEKTDTETAVTLVYSF
jgi:putative salt-induced outer membrane protein